MPLFPLHLVLFPGRPLPLHVFELRYREMLQDCLAADGRFGVIAIRAGAEVGGPPEIFDVGTVAEIQQVDALEDGRANLITRGVQRFKVRQLLSGKPYLRARVTLLDETELTEIDIQRAACLRKLLVPYLAGLGAPAQLLERLPNRPRDLAWLAASALQVEVAQQQHLLELDSCSRRLEIAVEMLRRETGLMRHFGTVGSLKPPWPVGAELN
ncbi:MAG: LON peptidase substrate-binding domain-containing protein [Egibacteraceae bacterium]